MNRKQKKARAKRRSQQYAAEKVVHVLTDNPFIGGSGKPGVLRHGKSITFR